MFSRKVSISGAHNLSIAEGLKAHVIYLLTRRQKVAASDQGSVIVNGHPHKLIA